MVIPVVVTFVVFFVGIYAAYWFFVVRLEDQAASALKRRLARSKNLKASQRSTLLKQMKAMSSVGALDAALKRGQMGSHGLQKLIEQSGARINVGTLLLASGTLGLIAFIVVQQLTAEALLEASGTAITSLVLAAAAGVLVSFVPVQILRFMRTRRMHKFEEQFPEALDLLSRAMRAGHSFTTGIEMVASEMPQPVGPEFRLLYDQQNYGMPLGDALKVFGERIPVLDARFFVTAVLIQRESGGNLAEVLDNLSTVIRERFRVKRQMRVISAHGRITGWILVALPPTLGVVLMTVNPEHRRTMFGDPLGIQMIVGAIVLQIIGTLIIRKIVNVEY